MKQENYINSSDDIYSEVTDTSETIQPATEVTKQALLDLITEKSKDGYTFEKEVMSKTLFFDKPTKGTIGIAKSADDVLKDSSIEHPAYTVRVEWSQWLNEDVYNKFSILNYSIFDTSDGLKIEKFHQNLQHYNESLRPDLIPEDKFVVNGLARAIKTHKTTDQLNNKPHNNFVSEKETKNLLSLIEQAQPEQ